MPRTGENICKRKDGRWEARYIKSYDFGGKARYAYLYAKTYGEVKTKLIKALNSNLNHTEEKTAVDFSCSYNEILDDWLVYCKPRVKESTYIRYKNSVNNHIRPHLGKYPIQKISTSLMEHYVSELLINGRKDGKGGLFIA